MALSQAKHLGLWAESQAVHLLIQAGYAVLYQNYHSRYGEIDIIATQAQELIFVEVKARQMTQHGHAFEVVSRSKQMKIFKTALSFIEKNQTYHNFYARFDVICFDFYKEIAKNQQQDFSNLAYDQQWIENAFTINADQIDL